MKKKKFKIVFNAPVVLYFTAICLLTLFLDYITKGWTNRHIFCVFKSSLLNPLTYVRFFTHIFGHVNFAHFTGNIMMILILGPMLEEKHGSKDLIFVIMSTAFVTGIVHYIFFPNSCLLGASGVVFAFILLASVTGAKQGEIPITLILVATIYLGEEIYTGITTPDNISQITHVIGGLVGAILGYIGQPKN